VAVNIAGPQLRPQAGGVSFLDASSFGLIDAATGEKKKKKKNLGGGGGAHCLKKSADHGEVAWTEALAGLDRAGRRQRSAGMSMAGPWASMAPGYLFLVAGPPIASSPSMLWALTGGFRSKSANHLARHQRNISFPLGAQIEDLPSLTVDGAKRLRALAPASPRAANHARSVKG